MIVYVDVIFFENLILDFIILLATGVICNRKIHIFRIILASFIGSTYTIGIFILGLDNIILKIIMSFLIIFISFGFNSKKGFLKNIGVFYLTSITFGGAAFMFMFSVNPKEIIFNSGAFIGLYPIKMALIGGIFGFFLIVIVGKSLKKKFLKFCNIEIAYNGKTVKTKALVDSGNLLKEAISNLPVVIVEKSILTGLIDNFILENIDNILTGRWLEESNSRVYDYKFRIIPFSSLGNQNGILLGFKADYVKIYSEDDYEKKEAVIGIYEESLSGASNEYNAIIGL